MMTQNETGDREYFRVKASLMVRLGPDTQKGRQAMAMDSEMWQAQSGTEQKAISIMENMSVDDEVKPLLEVMRWLDYKLDLVLHQLRTRELEEYFPLQTMTTDISGSGLGLVSAMEFEQGAGVLVALSLPDSPARPLYASGKIVRSDAVQSQNQAEFAVHFVDITDLNRERLIRFNFRQQRRALAARTAEEVL